MKVYVQPTADDPPGLLVMDSSDWPGVDFRPFAINIQGVTMMADWYCIEDKSYGCRAIIWNDDERWYPGSLKNAQIRTFKHIARRKDTGAWDTHQTVTYYCDTPRHDGHVARPWGQFRKPQNAKQGLLVRDDLATLHKARQEAHGWREWTDGVPDEEIVNGIIRDQVSLGRYIKPDGTRTYIQRDTARATGAHVAANETAFETATATAGTLVSSALAAGTDELGFCFSTDTDEPGDDDPFPTGNYRMQFDVNAIGGDITLGLLTIGGSAGHFARMNASLVDQETKTQTEAAVNSTGTTLVTTGSVSWTAGATTDRWECLVAVENGAGHGPTQDVTLNVNTASAFSDGPWTAPAAAGAPLFAHHLKMQWGR